MLIGLSNTLQCSEREAVRIALYEAVKSASDAYESTFILRHQSQPKRVTRDDPRRSNGTYQKQNK